MKIDLYTHILPKKFMEGLKGKLKYDVDISKSSGGPAKRGAILTEIDVRLRYLDRHPDVLQVLTMAVPPLERMVSPKDAVGLARIANDEMAELVTKYPDKFIAAVACLPLNDIDAALKEATRAIEELGLKGVQIFSNIDGESLDAPKFRPLYELMANYDLPIWIHPWVPPSWDTSMPFYDNGTYAWPYQTAQAMTHLVKSGVFEDYPDIKFVTHHCGGMVPFFEGRAIKWVDKLRKFYADTAVGGSTAALMCGYAFFGVDHILFGTDNGISLTVADSTLQGIRAVEGMDVSAIDKDKIFCDNARKLLQGAL